MMAESELQSRLELSETTGSDNELMDADEESNGSVVEALETKMSLKLDFMNKLALVTTNDLKELQCKRSEQRRRVVRTINLCYGQFEPEGQSESREDCCCLCRRSGELLMCDVCSLVYHLQCLDPPLTTVPVGLWSCPKCQSLSKLCGGKDDWPGTLTLVHSYLMHKAAREDEKQKMMKLKEELKTERKALEQRAEEVAELLQQRNQCQAELVDILAKSQQAYNSLRQFISMFHAK